MASRVYRFVSRDFRFRIAVVEGAELLREMKASRGLSPLVTQFLGESVLGAALLATHLKSGQGVGLLFSGDGVLQKLYAEAYYEGQVRAYCPQAQYDVSREEQWHLDYLLGNSQLTVVRHQPFQRAPFQGIIERKAPHISGNLENYLLQSQQISSRLELKVRQNKSLEQIELAFGVLLECMPGVEVDWKEQLLKSWDEKKDSLLENISQVLSQDLSHAQLPEQSLGQVFAQFFPQDPVSDIPHPYMLHYFCPCTKERVLAAMKLWGESGIQEMIDEGKGEQVSCQMCGQVYSLDQNDLEFILASIKKDRLH